MTDNGRRETLDPRVIGGWGREGGRDGGGWVPSGGSIEERLGAEADCSVEQALAPRGHTCFFLATTPLPATRFARDHLFWHLWSLVDLKAEKGTYLEGSAS